MKLFLILISYSFSQYSLAQSFSASIVASHGVDYQYEPGFNLNTKLGQYAGGTHTYNDSSSLITKLDEIAANPTAYKPGIMISLNAHGSKQLEYESSHTISLKDKDLSLDKIILRINHLIHLGLDVTFMDLSCYSSPVLKLVDRSPEHKKKLCVISGDSVNQASMATFTQALYKSFEEGLSLEAVFRKARLTDTSAPSAPGISTEAGLFCQKALKNIDSFITNANFWNYREIFKNDLSEDCLSSTPIIDELVKDLSPIMKRVGTEDYNIANLYDHTQEFSKRLLDLKTKYPVLNRPQTKKLSTGVVVNWFEANLLLSDPNSQYTKWNRGIENKIYRDTSIDGIKKLEILKLRTDQSLETLKQAYKGLDENWTKWLDDELENFKKYNDLLSFATNPSSSPIQNLNPDELKDIELTGLIERMWSISPERDLYESCYENYQKKHPESKDNPCSRMKLTK